MELSVAAPQVVAQRVSRMLVAGPKLSRADRNEFTRMGTEKVVAFYQSWASMWMQLGTVQLQALRSIWTLPTAAGSTSGAARRALRGQANAFTKILDAGLTPVHAKAVGNARRLARRAKRR